MMSRSVWCVSGLVLVLLATGPACLAQSVTATGKANTRSMLTILSLSGPQARTSDITSGLTAGQGVAPPVPVSEQFDRQTADAVVALYNNHTADQAAVAAADTATSDPALQERIGLARAVFRVDGSDAVIRHFIETDHMKLIIAEVARHIDFSKLSESDKYRLAAIAASAQTELEEKVLTYNATHAAQLLTKPELLQLMAAYDIDARRKQTAVMLNDDGKADSLAELDLRLAQFQIVKQFEMGQ